MEKVNIHMYSLFVAKLKAKRIN